MLLLQVPSHLAIVPDYLVPASLRAAAVAAGGGISSKKRSRAEQHGGTSDPLKSFAYNANKLGGAVGSTKVGNGCLCCALGMLLLVPMQVAIDKLF